MTPEEAVRQVRAALELARAQAPAARANAMERDVIAGGFPALGLIETLVASYADLARPAAPGEISVRSIYGAHTHEPFVQLVWGREVAQLTPAEARAHAALILDVAAAAVADAFVTEFARREVGLDVEQIAKMIAAFREWRARRNL